uniref:Putative secreted peptide n=1 Tax=Anopheles braziliensis TaxID=58242 RepID=A0A2M3ZVB2_9DIPT
MNAGRKIWPSRLLSSPLSMATGLCAGSGISWCAVPADQILTNSAQCCSKSTSCSTFASVVRSVAGYKWYHLRLDAPPRVRGESRSRSRSVPGKKRREIRNHRGS